MNNSNIVKCFFEVVNKDCLCRFCKKIVLFVFNSACNLLFLCNYLLNLLAVSLWNPVPLNKKQNKVTASFILTVASISHNSDFITRNCKFMQFWERKKKSEIRDVKSQLWEYKSELQDINSQLQETASLNLAILRKKSQKFKMYT